MSNPVLVTTPRGIVRVSVADVSRVVDRDDVWMVERSGRSRLPTEPLERIGILQTPVAQQFDGHVTPQPAVAGAIDLTHPAGAERAEHRVGADLSRRIVHHVVRCHNILLTRAPSRRPGLVIGGYRGGPA